MKMKEQIRLFAEMFNTDQAYARQCFTDVADFIEAVVASGDSVSLPGVITIGVRKTEPRLLYDFHTQKKVMTEGKYRPKIKIGKRLARAATESPELKDIIFEKNKDVGETDTRW